MGRWQLQLVVDRSTRRPIPTQLAEAITNDVRRGRLKPGDRLPGTRALAASLHVHRNTVLTAYRKLEAEGWLAATTGSGTFVSRELPEAHLADLETRRKKASSPDRRSPDAGFDLPVPRTRTLDDVVRPAARLALDWGVPDVRLFPTAIMSRAYRRALQDRGAEALGYGSARAEPRLHAALARMLSETRGLSLGPGASRLLLTRGSQMALYLVTQTLIRPGDVVAVEDPGYAGAVEACRLAGARVVPLPVDGDGVRVDALARLARKELVRAVFVTPHHQYPTTVRLAAARRLELLGLAAAKRIAVIEDDYDHEFHYDGPPVFPLATEDTAGVVIYIGSLSKIAAPGLRVGYLVAPAPLVAQLAALRLMIDVQNDRALELALAEMIEDGELQRHVRRSRRVYRLRRDAFAETLASELGTVARFSPPPGGLAFWIEVGPSVDVSAWAARARERGIVFRTAKDFTLSGRGGPFIRLGFAAHDEATMRQRIRELARALP